MSIRTFGPALLAAVTLAVGTVGVKAQDAKSAPDARDTGAFSITTGSGVNYIQFLITNVGRVYQIASPAGANHLWSGYYNVCDSLAGNNHGYSFTPVSFSQPNGAGRSPLTVVANSPGGAWQITHKFVLNTKELELSDTVVLKRLAGPVQTTYLSVNLDTAVDNGDANDIGLRSLDSTSVADTVGLHGLNLAALTRATGHGTAVNYYGSVVDQCFPATGSNPYGPADMGVNVSYNLAGFNAGQSKTVAFKFTRN